MRPALQQFMPQHALSRFAGLMANCKIPWVKNQLIRYFVNRHPVNMAESQEINPYAFPSFNAFFTRDLKPELRPIAGGLFDLVSPADGTISQISSVDQGYMIQAKNHKFTVTHLLGGDDTLAAPFINGSFVTVYLAPHDYHRVHMPIDGDLSQMVYIPGRLFSVNTQTAASTPNLFARNERVVSIFNTSVGRVAVILVGAMIVGSIETVWAGTVTAQRTGKIQTWQYEHLIRLKRGEEMGRFKLGSTVIVLLESKAVTWDFNLESDHSLKMGQHIGILKP